MLRACAGLFAALVVFASHGSANAQREEKPSPGSWPGNVYRWQYNPAHHPSWLSDEAARQLVVDASREWETCGIKMEYGGETQRASGVIDGVNVVGWQVDLPRNMRGVTIGRGRNGQLAERDVTFSAARPEFERYPSLLRKVIVHEFGHAIGLTHSATCDDVMSLGSDCRQADPLKLPQSPTPHDLERCRALYTNNRP